MSLDGRYIQFSFRFGLFKHRLHFRLLHFERRNIHKLDTDLNGTQKNWSNCRIKYAYFKVFRFHSLWCSWCILPLYLHAKLFIIIFTRSLFTLTVTFWLGEKKVRWKQEMKRFICILLVMFIFFSLYFSVFISNIAVYALFFFFLMWSLLWALTKKIKCKDPHDIWARCQDEEKGKTEHAIILFFCEKKNGTILRTFGSLSTKSQTE